jgi:hypothetical protein
MYALILIVLYGTNVSVTSIDFQSSIKCMEAVGKMVDTEVNGMTIKARCVAK